jgi:hypothetical protein
MSALGRTPDMSSPRDKSVYAQPAEYYGRMGKFSRFALVGGLVHQAITVPTHSLYVHARFSTISYAFPAHRARRYSVDA